MEGVGESREVGGRRYAVGGSGFLLEEFVNSHCRTDMSMLDAAHRLGLRRRSSFASALTRRPTWAARSRIVATVDKGSKQQLVVSATSSRTVPPEE